MKKIQLLALLLMISVHAFAKDVPWRTLTTGIAEADAIVVGKVANVITPPSSGEYVAEVDITSLLKGTPKEKHLTLRLQRHLGNAGLDAGAMYILFLARSGDPAMPYTLIGNMSRAHEEGLAEDIAAIVKQMPQWSRPEGGMSIIAVPDKFVYKAGENIDLSIGYKNTAANPAVLRYRNWPLDTHAYWTLDIRPRGGAPIAATPHPHVNAEEITEFFSKNGNSFDWTLKNGESFFLTVDRINSAQPGWGYKERLDFKYYAISKPGRYTIRVSSHNLYGDKPLTAEAFSIVIE